MSPTDPLHVFLCYRRYGTAAYAGRIYDRLVVRFGKEQIFMDVDSIEPGYDFSDAIRTAVRSCSVLLAVMGPDWLSLRDETGRQRINRHDDYVFIEISTALENGVQVIPVLVEGCRMPNEQQLPIALQGLAKRQSIEISHNRFDSDCENLIRALVRQHESNRRSSGVRMESDIAWRIDRVETDKHRRRIHIARRRRHVIECLIDIYGQRAESSRADEVLKLDGDEQPLASLGPDEPWKFSIMDAGEIFDARIHFRRSLIGSAIKGFWLEIDGQILFQDP